MLKRLTTSICNKLWQQYDGGGLACNQNDDQSINSSRLQRYLVHHVIKMMIDQPIHKDYLVECVGGGDGEPVPNVSLAVAIPWQASINIFD